MNQSIPDFLINLLQDPEGSGPLTYDPNTNKMVSSSGKTYDVEKGIPVLLKTSEAGHPGQKFDYARHYEKDAEVFHYEEINEHPVSAFENRRLHEMILMNLPKDPCMILDIGCGNGWVAASCLPKGHQVISADIGRINPMKAVTKYPSEKHVGLVADAFSLPLKNESIDIIIAAEIMEHVVDPKVFMAELYRCLRPGGKMIITTPYHEKLEYSLCIHCHQATPRHAHLHSFHEKNIPPIVPEGSRFELVIFMNKFLLKLYTHVVLKYFPFVFWKKIDQLANVLRPSALRMMVVVEKPK